MGEKKIQFGSDLGITNEDIEKISPQITFITSNADIEAIALVSTEGYQIAFSALPQYKVDGDQFCGLASALLMTGRTTIQQLFQEDLSEIILRAEDGYVVITNADKLVIVCAGTIIETLMKSVKVMRVAAKNLIQIFEGR
ncbi:MAG: roadblock/LC7 domain-containing protein [Candidatus Lokiarchaeota archaeon]|nr:roadblock/LC7 domain-containing protein [Candidatus Lokiarchaeota archaeon]